MKLRFPNKYMGYGKTGEYHYNFALHILRKSNLFDISLENFSQRDWPTFYIENKQILLNYEDFKNLPARFINYDYTFKTQLTDSCQGIGFENVFSWPQISFHDMTQIPKIEYTANSDIILNNQRPYGNAKERRTTIQSLLKNKYHDKVLIRHTYPQNDFFKLVSNCLTYVHVPGYYNNMIDRAHVQMFALGCCMITTYIPTIFPNNLRPIPGIHYVKCKDDYSDLIECIEWIRQNKTTAIEIGQNAMKLFNDSLSLEAFKTHIVRSLKL